MLQIEIKNCFVELGHFLSQFNENKTIKKEAIKNNDSFFEKFNDLIQLSQSHNNWFTPENVFFAIQSWTEALTDENLSTWLSNYTFENTAPKKIGKRRVRS